MRALCAVAIVLAACGDDGSAMPDAGAPMPDSGLVPDSGRGADELPSGAMLAAPAPAELPRLATCPKGWRSSDGACEPWPLDAADTCGPDEAHFPGAPGCVRLGPACPPSGLPDVAGTAILYVRAGAAAGGDGSRAAPFATIGEATAVATAGTTIAVGTGDYDEPVSLASGVSLVGACVRGTHLDWSMRTEALATVVVEGTDVMVRNFTIGGARAGLVVDAEATAIIEDVIVDHATETGLRIHYGGQGALDRVVIRDTQIDPGDLTSAFGLVVEYQGHGVGRHMVIERNHIAGALVASAGSDLTLSDTVIRDTRVGTPMMFGVGAISQQEGAMTLERVVLEGNSYFGAGCSRPGTSMVIRDSVIRDVIEAPEGWGIGILTSFGATLVVERTLVERARNVGIMALSALVEVRDTIVREIEPGAAGEGGGGIVLQFEASGTVERVRIERTRTAGVSVTDHSLLTATDVTVLDTAAQLSDGQGGRGIQVQLGGELDVTRALVVDATDSGLYSIAEGAVLRARDVTVVDTRAEPSTGIGTGLAVFDTAYAEIDRLSIAGSIGWGVLVSESHLGARDLRVERTTSVSERAFGGGHTVGRGIDVQRAGEAVVERAIISENRLTGVAVVDGSTMVLRDAVVRGTMSEESTRSGGLGVMAIMGSQLTMEDTWILGNREVGAYAEGEGSVVEMTRVTIEGTLPVECLVDTCPEQTSGIGAGAYSGGVLRMTDFTVTRNALCGVQVARGGSMDLTDGTVSHHPVGANVQDTGYDIDRLSTRVQYLENGTTLDSQSLPIPTPTGSIPVEM